MDDAQQELPLPFPELSGDMPLLPARMVNEYQYCPQLAYLEWVQGEWAASADTVEGAHVHRRVDKPGGALPDPATVDAGCCGLGGWSEGLRFRSEFAAASLKHQCKMRIFIHIYRFPPRRRSPCSTRQAPLLSGKSSSQFASC